MKNEREIFNGYMPFYNNGNSNIFEKEKYSIFKDNNKQNQSINLFQKHFRSKIPKLNNRSLNKKFENFEQDKNNNKKENSETNNNLPSQPNLKNNTSLFRKITLNSKNININSLYNKLHDFKSGGQDLTPLKNINIDFLNRKINTDNYQLSKKERDIEKIKYLMKQKENKYTTSSITKYSNNTLTNNRLNNCFTIFSLKSQPLINQKKSNKTIDTKNKLFNKFSIKRNNNKLTSLPKMSNSNTLEKHKTSEIHRISSKTFFNVHNKKSKTHNLEIKSFLKPLNKKRTKMKNLVSFDVYSLPGTERGKQKINQDSYLVLPNINNTKNCKIFGVFDGHGDNSDALSQEIRDYFIDYFSDNNIYKQGQENIIFSNKLNNINKISNDDKLEKVYNLFNKNNYNELHKLFNNINNKLHEKYKDNNFCLISGSTSNLVIIMNDKKENCLNKIISINLGDSKSILITEDNQAIDLNTIHHLEDANERERIENNGGEISRVDWADYGPLRVYYKGKNYPGLAMTRAFGDFNAEPLGINTIPDIREYDILDKKPKIIVLATDGVWQFLSNEKVKDILLPYYDEDNISGAAQKLVKTALRIWENKNPNFIDDITVIILFFR